MLEKYLTEEPAEFKKLMRSEPYDPSEENSLREAYRFSKAGTLSCSSRVILMLVSFIV
jgi:hypothetical protein